MRKNIYKLIKPKSEDTTAGKVYDIVMIVVICLSLVPLFFKETARPLYLIDKITVSIFILDYLLRWVTADYLFGERGIKPFIKYPFSLMAIIDVLSIIPSLTIVHNSLKTLRIIRLIRALKVITVFRSFRYTNSMTRIFNVFNKQKNALVAVLFFALAYIFVTALIVFQAEPYTFNGFLDALYWATVSITTVGYGDIVVVSVFGKIVTIISTFVGVAVIALPSAIITAGYMEEIHAGINK